MKWWEFAIYALGIVLGLIGAAIFALSKGSERRAILGIGLSLAGLWFVVAVS